MATIGNTYLGLADIYKGKTKTGQVADIINMLRQTNAIMEDAVARECNEGKSHKHTVLSGLPSAFQSAPRVRLSPQGEEVV